MNDTHFTEALKSDIDTTRRRMDETMDALGNRLQGRHLLDELLGLFRKNDSDGAATREKLKNSAQSALNSVVDTVKENPVPVLLIGVGIGWMIYNSRRTKRGDDEEFASEDTDYEPETEFAAADSEGEIRYDPDTHYDRPLEYPSSGENVSDKFESAKETLKEKAAAATEQVKEKLSDVGEQAREKIHSMRERASELGAQVKDRTRKVYQRSREKVAATADEHPLALGLGCLAIGLIAGLSLPTPEKVNRVAGPTVDRLRNRTRAAGRELLDKGKRVVQTATEAAKDEAKSQGLSFESPPESAAANSEANTNSGNESGSIAVNPSPA